VAEALDGETLMLGPVPAWRLPVHQGGPAPGIDAPRVVRGDESVVRGDESVVRGDESVVRGDEASVRRGVAPSTARARRDVVVALFPRGHRPPRDDDPTRAEDGPPEAAGAEPARFGWFRAAR
jgi:hypothetical protein